MSAPPAQARDRDGQALESTPERLAQYGSCTACLYTSMSSQPFATRGAHEVIEEGLAALLDGQILPDGDDLDLATALVRAVTQLDDVFGLEADVPLHRTRIGQDGGTGPDDCAVRDANRAFRAGGAAIACATRPAGPTAFAPRETSASVPPPHPPWAGPAPRWRRPAPPTATAGAWSAAPAPAAAWTGASPSLEVTRSTSASNDPHSRPTPA